MWPTLFAPRCSLLPAPLQVLAFYNCADLPSQRYDVTFLNQTVNQRPYCAELYNPQDLPYAFHFFPLEGKPNGFPVYFDINLSQGGAQVRQPHAAHAKHGHVTSCRLDGGPAT